jgi:hypothetical protein
MKKSLKVLGFAALIASVYGATGCGGGSSSSAGSQSAPTSTAQVVQGKWTIHSTSTQGQSNTITLINFTDQGGGSFFAPQAIICSLSPTVVCQGSLVGQEVLTLQGSVTDGGGLSMSLLIQDASDASNSCTITISGTLSGGTSMSGNYTGCQDAGTFTGVQNVSSTGTYVGSINSTVSPSPIAVGFSTSVTEGPDFALTGSASLTNSVCFSNLTFGPPSMAIGEGIFLQDTSHGIYAVALPSEPAPNVGYAVTASQSCGTDQGQGQIKKQ